MHNLKNHCIKVIVVTRIGINCSGTNCNSGPTVPLAEHNYLEHDNFPTWVAYDICIFHFPNGNSS